MTTPRISRLFLERADTQAPAFRAWFQNSKVVNPDGSPAVVYHGTTSKQDFQAFTQTRDIGAHFGTSQAANDRLDAEGGHGRVYPVFLSIQNPLEMHDMETWEPGDIIDTLVAHEKLPEGAERTDKDVLRALSSQGAAAWDAVKRVMRRLGYDGIRYENAIEDPGSISWIVLDPGQVKSVYNRGTWDRRRASISQ